MLGMKKIDPDLDAGKVLDAIEKSVYAAVKPYGFKKHGRTLHRFVLEDISQAITFQLGQAYWGETHLLWVNTGIRVPECMTRSFTAEASVKKYYPAYACNIRSRLGEIEGREAACYDLRDPIDRITGDILRQVQALVIPAFEELNSREAILAKRRAYPHFDLLNAPLILLEEAMMYGRSGDIEKAAETFKLYYRLFGNAELAQKDPKAIQNHLRYLDGLAAELGITLR